MEFLELSEKEYQEFYNSYENSNFMQSLELGNLKKEYGYVVRLVGVRENNKIIAASLLLESTTFFRKKIFYAPRGLMVDYHNLSVLSFFVDNLKKYIKNKNGFTLTIDPNIIYRERLASGDIKDLTNDVKDYLSINNLLKLGFKHHGFNLYLDALQARWCYRLKLDDDLDNIKNNFSKSVKKNIKSTYEKGLQVRIGTINDLDEMTEIFDMTAKRKDFFSRSLDYYKKMYKNMHNLMTIYIAYLEPNKYIENTLMNLNEEKKHLEEIMEKFNKDMVGNKLKNEKETCIKRIEKLELELEKAYKFKEDYPNGKDIGCLLSIKSGNEYLTLSSGVLEEYKSFTPKYQMYDCHIKDAYENGFKYCNFYGITGDFNKKNKYYGIYEFKKGFGGNVIEYIGEFDLEITKFNKIYNFLKRIKHIVKK